MSRGPSEPVLAWLRQLIDKRGLNTAEVAAKCELPRARVRKILTGAEPMTLDELLKISTALEISPGDLGLPGSAAEAEAEPEPPPVRLAEDGETEGPKLGLDPWGNHPEQLIRVGFALACDFLFLADGSQLEGSGLPAQVAQQYRETNLPIRLDAAYHRHNAPRYDPGGITLTLSFDGLYDCRFPWSSIRQVVFLPAPAEPVAPAEPPSGKPRLRLVE
jgi:DNA-binding Xre family transcriptional regulator